MLVTCGGTLLCHTLQNGALGFDSPILGWNGLSLALSFPWAVGHSGQGPHDLFISMTLSLRVTAVSRRSVNVFLSGWNSLSSPLKSLTNLQALCTETPVELELSTL